MGAPDDACMLEKGDGGRHVPWWRRRCVLLLVCLAALLVGIIILIIALTAGTNFHCPEDSTQTPDGYGSRRTWTGKTEDVDSFSLDMQEPEFTLADGRFIIRRSEWTSTPPDFRRSLPHPTPYVVIGHTAGPPCSDLAHCFLLLRTYQNEHRELWQQPDISYNFLIDVSGNVYEGRGWDTTNNHQSWAMRCNLAVTLLGNFMHENVTTEMMDSLRQLLDLGVELGKLDPQYRLVAQNQLMSTLSPGTNALQAISTWPHRCLDHCDEGVQCGARDTDGLDV